MNIFSIIIALFTLPSELSACDKHNEDRKKYYSPEKKLLRHSEAVRDSRGEIVIVDEPLVTKISLS